MRRWRPGLALILAVGGCAYYNGLWRANRFASEARRAEQEGRIGEARSLWAQAAVRAESVVVRHPDSKWTDDALLLHGRALLKLQQCSVALQPLERALETSPDGEIVEAASLLAAQCRIEMSDPARARALLDQVVRSSDPERASRARYWRGLAAQRLGDHRAATADLEASHHPGAAVVRIVSLLALGDIEAASPTIDSLLEAGASEEQWQRVITALVGADLAEAERVVTALTTSRSGLGLGPHARLALTGASRVAEAGDTARALRLFERVTALSPDSATAREAEVRMVAVALARATSPEDLPPLIQRLEAVAVQGGSAGRLATGLAALAARVIETPGGEGRQFLLAEVALDSLRAADLAATMLLELVERSPASLFAPKALLAAAVARPDLADSLRTLAQNRYPGSPYLLALSGRVTPIYAQLEDSLLTLGGGAGTGSIAVAGSRQLPVETGPAWVALPDAPLDGGRRGRRR